MPQIELSAGTIEYTDTGGGGPVIVLLHGLLMDATLWDEVTAASSPSTSPLSWPKPSASSPAPALSSGGDSNIPPRLTNTGQGFIHGAPV